MYRENNIRIDFPQAFTKPDFRIIMKNDLYIAVNVPKKIKHARVIERPFLEISEFQLNKVPDNSFADLNKITPALYPVFNREQQKKINWFTFSLYRKSVRYVAQQVDTTSPTKVPA